MSTTATDTRAVVDTEAAERHLMRFLAIDGVSGKEAAIAGAVVDALQADRRARHCDPLRYGEPAHPLADADRQSRSSTCRARAPAPRMAFATHLDTVPLCAGAKPKRQGGRIVGDGTTALGGDNRTGCAVLVALAETLLKHHLPHPPITLIFTVREESRLIGARNMDPAELAGVDDGLQRGRQAAGRADHRRRGRRNLGSSRSAARRRTPGVAPEKGISATLAAPSRIAEAHRGGWFGKVVKPEGRGTSNVGVFGGREKRSAGDATNVVTDYVHIDGESRSDDEAFTSAITAAFKQAFVKAAEQVKDDGGEAAEAKFDSRADYFPFRLSEIRRRSMHAKHAAESIGLKPTTRVLPRRARRQLVRAARPADGDHRRRPARDPHREGVRGHSTSSSTAAAWRWPLATLDA